MLTLTDAKRRHQSVPIVLGLLLGSRDLSTRDSDNNRNISRTWEYWGTNSLRYVHVCGGKERKQLGIVCFIQVHHLKIESATLADKYLIDDSFCHQRMSTHVEVSWAM
jgi:hypothetical protein